MATIKVLQEHGVPLYSTSIQSFAKQLEDSLTELEAQLGAQPIALIERTIGRSTYHLAIFPTVAQEAQVSEELGSTVAKEAQEAPKRGKSKSKATESAE